jgi:hypothetical protein
MHVLVFSREKVCTVAAASEVDGSKRGFAFIKHLAFRGDLLTMTV